MEMGSTERAATDDNAVLVALRLAMGISIQAADEIGDLSTVQLRAVTVLSERPGANLGELAQGMAVSPSVTSRLVDRLVAAGFAERRPSASSGREISLWLTPAGERILRRYDDLRLRKVHERLRELPPERAAEVVAALQSLIAAVGGSTRMPT
ncbi:MarR family winged helix-turn-helix transcriptional regulator [Geodermatophilus sp. FMUSA9-8]|uniref:MarR family winged helix-turn-helix transcriptional regulator n=1 Tax=Geodermatophilus sp. FMUSA9-8 TaxID=3120155 RepID=UPI003009A42D